MSALTEQRDSYTNLVAWGPSDKELAEVGWTREVYDRMHAEAELAQYEKDRKIERAGISCQVKRELAGTMYRRTLHATGYYFHEEV